MIGAPVVGSAAGAGAAIVVAAVVVAATAVASAPSTNGWLRLLLTSHTPTDTPGTIAHEGRPNCML